MKRYPDIKRILVKDMGLRCLADYRRWVDEVRPGLVPTPEMIARLSPDEVDCRDFWKVCDELFGIDPVCNVVANGSAVDDTTPLGANRANQKLARTLGITAFLEENAHEELNVLEIGPGYGGLHSFVELHTRYRYRAVDVVARFPGVELATPEGFLPRALVEQEAGKFSYVVASNVFQHLSARQRTRHLVDAQKLLHAGGLLLFNLFADTGKAHLRDAAGTAYCDHYGQFTPIPKVGALYDEIGRSFGILYVTQRYDGLFHFVCKKERA